MFGRIHESMWKACAHHITQLNFTCQAVRTIKITTADSLQIMLFIIFQPKWRPVLTIRSCNLIITLTASGWMSLNFIKPRDEDKKKKQNKHLLGVSNQSTICLQTSAEPSIWNLHYLHQPEVFAWTLLQLSAKWIALKENDSYWQLLFLGVPVQPLVNANI